MANPLNAVAAAMNAQMMRLNITASNLANADTLASSEAEAYRARQPVFTTVLDAQRNPAGVAVSGIIESDAPIPKRYEPNNPLADEAGYVYGTNVNTADEMANMMSATRSFQNSTEVFSTIKTLQLRALQLGQQ